MQFLRFLALSCFLAVAPTWASVVLQLTATTQDASPGQTIVFGGLIINNHPEIIDLNGLSISLAGPFTFDVSPFFDFSAPLSVDANGGSTAVYDWFTVTVADPYTDPFGVVNGTITLQGGLQGPNGYDPLAQDVLATVDFSVNVVSPDTGTDVPEPASTPLLLCLLILLSLARRNSIRGVS